jgi:pimeloyl-ACP methyl ester carboxylesterase
MSSTIHYLDNGAGFELALKQCLPARAPEMPRPPIVIVPGYGMNAHIFGYHPAGADQSLEATLTGLGFEVWSVNLRGQEPSRRRGGACLYGFRDIVRDDLARVVPFVLEHTATGRDTVTLVGCSLGGTYVYAYLALVPDAPVSAVVALGAPLRWVEIHPVLESVFGCPRVVGAIPFRGTRTLARLGLPLLRHVPALLHLYLHPEMVDLSDLDEIVRTVEDPNRRLNREIAEWIKARDLVLDGTNVSEAFADDRRPLLCVVANADGIVPPATAMYPREISSAAVRDVLCVGTEEKRYAHADLYLARTTKDDFFLPLGAWLLGLPD